jgi:hypothetical protein
VTTLIMSVAIMSVVVAAIMTIMVAVIATMVELRPIRMTI